MQNEERWLPVCGLEGRYEVSSLGRIRRVCPHNAKTIIGLRINRGGYVTVAMRCPGRRIRARVHRLVAESFIGPSALTVNHINGIKTDNRPENLEYVSHADNIRHGMKLGLYEKSPIGKGERHFCAKLTEQQVRTIRLLATEHSNSELGRQFNVSRETIRAIVNRRSWAHVS